MSEIINSVTFDETTFDTLIQFEVMLFLSPYPELLSFYSSLKFHSQIGATNFINQKDLAFMMNLTEPTFIKRKNALIRLGLLEIKSEGNSRNYNLKIFSKLKNFKLPKSLKEMRIYLDNSRKSLQILGQENKSQITLSNIYNNITSKNNNTNTNINITNKTYPREDYNLVLEAFQRYKGIKLAGPEIPQQLKAIKMMFQAERKPQEIVNCMKWFYDHQDDEETSWARNWTIWTVQKKMAEFIAGKLGGSTSLDEEYPTYTEKDKQW